MGGHSNRICVHEVDCMLIWLDQFVMCVVDWELLVLAW